MSTLAWGAKVSPAFRARVDLMGAGLGVDPSWLMAAMAWESARTFSPSVRNAAGSGAVGLIQFMPATAAALGTTIEALVGMTAEAQLEYVGEYFRPWSGRMHSLGDTYSVVLWPGMVGKPNSFVAFRKDDKVHPKLYLENRGLDWSADGLITKADACRPVAAQLALGLKTPNVWNASV